MSGEKNPGPVHVTASQATTKSFQVKEYLLCPECEDRFRLGGEEWVLKNGYRGTGSFPIHTVLSGAKAIAVLSQASMIDARTITAIDLAQLSYFALSVFWRASACPWDALDHFTRIDLGRYQENLRRFLLGEEGFPERAVLIVSVSTNPKPQLGAVFPYSNRVNGIWQHRFSIPGMAFWLHLGTFRDKLPMFCAVREGMIFYAHVLDANFECEMGSLIRTAKPTAALRS